MIPLCANEFLYRGIPRWDFGLDSPNKAATILAFLLLLLLAAILRTRRRWLAWSCTVLAAPIGYAFAHTFSRGGFVALLAGATAIVANHLHRQGGKRLLPLLLVAGMVAASAVWIGFAARLAASAPSADMSAGNRLVVWRAVPDMMADAPGGWGLGNSGTAFMSWYQPLSRNERYRSLVNSHFTWLVEFGWFGRCMIAAGWVFALCLGAIHMKRKQDPLPLSLWLCLGTAAFFSSVAEEWYAWTIPIAALPPMAKTFLAPAAKTDRRRIIHAAIGGGLIFTCAVAAWGHFRADRAFTIHRDLDGKRIVLGEAEPADWIVFDEQTMGGPCYGRALRAFAQTPAGKGRAFGIASELAAVPETVRRLALCGRSADGGHDMLKRFARLENVRILAPARPLDWLAWKPNTPKLQVICGDLSPNCPDEDVAGLKVVPGVGDYFPAWPYLAFAPIDSGNSAD